MDGEQDMNGEQGTNGEQDVNGDRPRRTRTRTRIVIAVIAVIGAIATTAIVATAFGESGDHHPVPAGAAGGQADAGSNHRQAVAFAKCMRSHGDPAFPDPGPEGAFPNDNGSLDKSSAGFKKAGAACKGLEPKGHPDFKADYQKSLKYSACMRAHGMPKFPDPVLDEHGVGISGEIDMNSSQFKTAHAACRSLLPGGGL